MALINRVCLTKKCSDFYISTGQRRPAWPLKAIPPHLPLPDYMKGNPMEEERQNKQLISVSSNLSLPSPEEKHTTHIHYVQHTLCRLIVESEKWLVSPYLAHLSISYFG